MKRGVLLKLARIFAGKSQLEVAERFGADQSTISRIEKESMYITFEMELRFIEACGGRKMLHTLLDAIQKLIDRSDNDHLLLA